VALYFYECDENVLIENESEREYLSKLRREMIRNEMWERKDHPHGITL